MFERNRTDKLGGELKYQLQSPLLMHRLTMLHEPHCELNNMGTDDFRDIQGWINE